MSPYVHFDRVLRDDIRDLEQLHNIQALNLFVDALRERVGSSIVLSNIAEDLHVSQKTLKRWLEVLEKMYLVFIVRPYTKKLPRAIQKPPKVYFFDNGDVRGDEGARFENLVATHLLKQIHFLEDQCGDSFQLHYIRDKEGHEVDFAVVKNRQLVCLIEAKYSDASIHSDLRYYADRLKPKTAYQIVAQLKKSYSHGSIKVQTPFEDLAAMDSFGL